MTVAIDARTLTKTYGDKTAVDGVTFQVPVGQIFGYLGRNGSGKTTTVRMLATLTKPTSGSAHVAGHDVESSPAEVKAHIGVTMQEAALDPQMQGREHLEFIARVLGFSRTDASSRANEMLELFGLTDSANDAIATYSGGMKRRLDIGTALLARPSVLFLDEPTTGLDPQSRRVLWDEIRSLRDRGTTIFLTTQYLEEADVLTDHLAIIDQGSLLVEGTARDLKARHGRKLLLFDRSDRSDALVKTLRSDVILDLSIVGERVSVELPAEAEPHVLLSTLATLTDANGSLNGLEVAETSLEDVFLRLTGSDINQSTTDKVGASQ